MADTDRWMVIREVEIIDLLRRANAGEDPDVLYAEAYANSEDVGPT